MAEITCTPKGHAGYTCEVISACGNSILITRLDLESDPTVEGDGALSANTSLVGRLGAYADNELAHRRARDKVRKTALRQSADLHRKIVLDLADLIDLVGDETTTGWCSACLAKHEHRWVQRRSLTPDAFLCDGCGAATTPCLWPRCGHFALRKPGADDNYAAGLVCSTVAMAVRNGRVTAEGAVFHSDRGSQYTSADFGACLADAGMVGSMGAVGTAYDNAAAETWFATLKKELVHRTVFDTRAKAVAAVTNFIEVWYNRKRLHQTLGYRTPAAVREHYNNHNNQAA